MGWFYPWWGIWDELGWAEKDPMVWAGALFVPQQGKQLYPVCGSECRKAPTRPTPWQQNCQRLRNGKRLKTTAKQWQWAAPIFSRLPNQPLLSLFLISAAYCCESRLHLLPHLLFTLVLLSPLFTVASLIPSVLLLFYFLFFFSFSLGFIFDF